MKNRFFSCRGVSVAALLVAGWLPAGLAAGTPLEDVQKSVTQWAQIRAETVRLEADWSGQQALLQSTLDALQGRVRQLEERRTALEAKTAAGRREMEELRARREAITAAAAQAATDLQALDERLVRLRPYLPPRLSAALELPYRSLQSAALGPAERMQHTAAILNRCAHFNRTLTRAEERIVPPGGEPKLMEAVYWGLSHGYALDRAGGVAYAGSPGAEGWRWTPAPELLRPVTRLLAVAADKATPELVVVPLPASEAPRVNLSSGESHP